MNIHFVTIIGEGPFPGVIEMFGSSGGLANYRSALLASRGFATLGLAYFGYDDLPKDMSDVDLDYFEVCSSVTVVKIMLQF